MATTPIKVGSDEPQLQHWENSASFASGSQTTREYKGISLAKMSALANQAAAVGWDGRLRYEFNVATLTLTRSGNQIPGGINSPFSEITDKWELGVDQERPELFDNVNFVQASTSLDVALGTNAGQQLGSCIRALSSGSDSTWAGFWKKAGQTDVKTKAGGLITIGSGSSAGIFTIQSLLYDISVTYPAFYETLRLFIADYLLGQTTFLRGKYVLRHTTIAPNTYAANVADFNVEKIYTIAQLLSECQSTSLWILPLPDYLAYKISNFVVPSYMNENRQWGALKTRSNAVLAANNRIEISTEYLIDGWPIHTYGLAT